MIKGKFIEKCKSQNLRRVLLKDPPEKLEQLISVARAHEEAYRQANMMKEKTVTCGKDIIIQNQAEIQHSDQHMMPKLNSVQMQTNRNKNVHDAVNGLIQAKTVGLRAKLVLHVTRSDTCNRCAKLNKKKNTQNRHFEKQKVDLIFS